MLYTCMAQYVEGSVHPVDWWSHRLDSNSFNETNSSWRLWCVSLSLSVAHMSWCDCVHCHHHPTHPTVVTSTDSDLLDQHNYNKIMTWHKIYHIFHKTKSNYVSSKGWLLMYICPRAYYHVQQKWRILTWLHQKLRFIIIIATSRHKYWFCMLELPPEPLITFTGKSQCQTQHLDYYY